MSVALPLARFTPLEGEVKKAKGLRRASQGVTKVHCNRLPARRAGTMLFPTLARPRAGL